ncbi:hypothetical protein EYC84_000619 [Monilinia fructicola]|uniref:HORMA domain-containing protein n=1 Tax=Monilinia fructicola TaxID=38448 RepID=A0A5M9JRH8_MONFR|nr:hypothetical protein EYC84_000619 [Monilinia fructicola]
MSNEYPSLPTHASSLLPHPLNPYHPPRARSLPPNTFLLTRAFNFPVPQNRHPQLCAYINSCVAALTPHLQAGTIDSLSVVIYSDAPLGGEIQILERYMFSLSRFPTIPISERFTEFEFRAAGDPSEIRNVDVEEELRATLRKLAYSAGKLEELKNPEDCTWGVVMEMKEMLEARETRQLDIRNRLNPRLRSCRFHLKGRIWTSKEREKPRRGEPEATANSRIGRARGGVKKHGDPAPSRWANSSWKPGSRKGRQNSSPATLKRNDKSNEAMSNPTPHPQNGSSKDLRYLTIPRPGQARPGHTFTQPTPIHLPNAAKTHVKTQERYRKSRNQSPSNQPQVLNTHHVKRSQGNEGKSPQTTLAIP